jgi:hypothetical protein
MNIFFKLMAGWVCLNFFLVYVQTKSTGHLIASAGAFLVLSANLFLDDVVGMIMLIGGKYLFWTGVAVIGSFGRRLEQERLRSSSWFQILVGRVPVGLQPPSSKDSAERRQVIQGIIIAVLFGVIFYFGDEIGASIIFGIIAIVFGMYFLSRVRGPS